MTASRAFLKTGFARSTREPMQRLCIRTTWNGIELDAEEHAWVDVERGPTGLCVAIEAPFYGDAPPQAPAGSTPGLWEFEVVELFVAGEDRSKTSSYLELEVGPHGHHLVLGFEGVRQRAAVHKDLALRVGRLGGRWSANLSLPFAWLLPAPWFANAYAIYGSAEKRRYLASNPIDGKSPDFHQPASFLPLAL